MCARLVNRFLGGPRNDTFSPFGLNHSFVIGYFVIRHSFVIGYFVIRHSFVIGYFVIRHSFVIGYFVIRHFPQRVELNPAL